MNRNRLVEISTDPRTVIREHLRFLYGDACGAATWEKLARAERERELADPGTERYRIFRGYRALLAARRRSPAFNPYAPQSVPDCATAVVGPLVEVPALIGLVNVSLYFQRRYFGPTAKPIATNIPVVAKETSP